MKNLLSRLLKPLFIAVMILISISAVVASNPERITEPINQSSTYCDGWKEGYCEGWKDVKGQYAICPVTPTCPIANPGQTRYKDGYNRGFKAGRAAAKK